MWTERIRFAATHLVAMVRSFSRTGVRIEAVMAVMQPIRVEIEREADGRILASIPDLPGVMAYGAAEDEAVRKVKAIALQVLADMIEHGEEIPEPLNTRSRDEAAHVAADER